MKIINHISPPYLSQGFPRARLLGLLLSTLLMASCATHQEPESAAAKPSTTAMEPTAQRRYTAALENIQTGDYAQAQRALQALTDDYDELQKVWINLAVAYYQGGKLDAAAKALSRAETIESDIPAVQNLQGLIAMERGNYEAAEQYFLAALDNDPEHAHSHYNLALLYDIFFQSIARAVPHYDRYLALTDAQDPDTARWVQQLKRTLEREEDQ